MKAKNHNITWLQSTNHTEIMPQYQSLDSRKRGKLRLGEMLAPRRDDVPSPGDKCTNSTSSSSAPATAEGTANARFPARASRSCNRVHKIIGQGQPHDNNSAPPDGSV